MPCKGKYPGESTTICFGVRSNETSDQFSRSFLAIVENWFSINQNGYFL